MEVNGRIGCVYFLQMQNSDGYIKIGFTNNIIERQATLQTGSPYVLEIKALLPGISASAEKTIHFLLNDSKIIGEWFRPTDKVLECIKYVNQGKFEKFIEKYVYL